MRTLSQYAKVYATAAKVVVWFWWVLVEIRLLLVVECRPATWEIGSQICDYDQGQIFIRQDLADSDSDTESVPCTGGMLPRVLCDEGRASSNVVGGANCRGCCWKLQIARKKQDRVRGGVFQRCPYSWWCSVLY